GFDARRRESEARGRLRGIGISTVIENTGAGIFPKDQVELEFAPDGSVTAYTLAQSSGQSHETTFAMVIAETLGVGIEQVTVKQSPLGKDLVGNHTGGSRSMAG